MYCVVINVLAQTNGMIVASSDFMTESVTSETLENLKNRALINYRLSSAFNQSHEISWYYSSVHNIFKL